MDVEALLLGQTTDAQRQQLADQRQHHVGAYYSHPEQHKIIVGADPDRGMQRR